MPSLAVVIPVYRDLAVTRACIESVLASDLPPDAELIVIDDASPEPALRDYCRTLADHPRVTLLAHTDNRGFVASVNAGMASCPDRDVVLLNSDTQVANDWLQRLQRAAYASERVATVTPFSNNASICSYPEMGQSNELPEGISPAVMDSLVAEANAGRWAELPTAVGFCMYIRRACLEQIGDFDEARFGRGYGEENEFCLRASAMGWSHRLAADVFVFHQGSVSFGADRHALMRRADQLLAETWPDYHTRIQLFIQRDPLAPLRKALTQRLVSQVLAGFVDVALPRVLFVTHAWGGGVEQHVQDLVKILSGKAQILILRGLSKGRVELELVGAEGVLSSWRLGGFDQHGEAWHAALSALGFARVHLHHIHGWSPGILSLIQRLGIPVDVTVHDYYPVSPRYHLSPLDDEAPIYEAQTDSADAWPLDVPAWQARFAPLLRQAARVIAPSQDVAQRLLQVFPGISLQVEPHPEEAMVFPEVIKVALLGGLSPAKGLDLVVCVVARTRERQLPVSFRLLGHSAQPLPPGVTATGSYQARDLGYLINSERPDVIWLPSLVHETFGYTLSVALASGKPLVATAVGAFCERLAGQPQAKTLPVTADADAWLDALLTMARSSIKAPRYSPRSQEDYARFYLSGLTDIQAARARTNDLGALLLDSPKAVPEPAVPIKSLFQVGVYGGHTASVKEVERCLSVLPDDEVALAPWREFARQADELDKTQDALRQYVQSLEISDKKYADAADGLRQYRESYEASQRELDAALDGLRQYRERLDQVVADAETRRKIIEAERDQARQHVMELVNSTSWKITRPLRFFSRLSRSAPRLLALMGRPAAWRRLTMLLRRGGLSAVLERARQELHRTPVADLAKRSDHVETHLLPGLQSESAELLPLQLSTSESPRISILIPVYGQHRTTYNCLASIAANPPGQDYEVIIADDASPEPAADALDQVSGIRIVRHPQNLGFLGNVNQGLQSARGEWLILLNNDTLVCHGALDALVRTFDEHEGVGLVGAKLLNRDGSVQEAGGIIWRDGSGWNWGRNQQRDDPRFNYVRDVDYCSGAVLAMPRELFVDMGGFDERYAPAYYEDTDLAFRIRERGLRVLYQPAAEVYHLEGISHGTDTGSGVKAYQQVNARKFHDRWRSVLEAHRENADQPELEAHRHTRGNILVVEACMITPDQDSGSLRMLNLLALLKREGYQVTFVADNLEYQARYVNQLQQSGVEVYHGHWAGGGVHKLLKRLGPDLDAIIVCRHYIASRYFPDIRRLAPRARIIFDTVDLHFVREEREARLHNNNAMLHASAKTREQELSLVAASDLTLVVSEFEKTLLAQLVPDARVEIVSNIHSHSPVRPGYAAREGIIFVGGFRHPPNADAINWYAREVLPHLRHLLPGVKTRVIGSNMSENLKSLASEDLELLGFIENIEPWLQGARVSIAPLRYGAGVKGKVNEAMNYGIPVVATACAVEGMYLEAGVEVMVADDARAFADSIARVYNDEALWQQLSRAGVENVRRHFSPEAALPTVRRMLDSQA